jgi:hypothetical protein
MYCVGVSGMPAGTWTQLTLMKGTKRFPLILDKIKKLGNQIQKFLRSDAEWADDLDGHDDELDDYVAAAARR